MCEPKSPSLSTGSVVHTPGLHTSSPVATSVTPGTPVHSCGSKSPSLSTSSVVHTPGLHMSSPVSSSAASTPSSSHTPHPRSGGSSPDRELRYISKYLVQYVPAPPNTKASAAKQISGARVLTNAKCAAILEEREEKKRKEQEKDKRKADMEQKKEKEEAAKKQRKEQTKLNNQLQPDQRRDRSLLRKQIPQRKVQTYYRIISNFCGTLFPFFCRTIFVSCWTVFQFFCTRGNDKY